ncbi:MAG: hypothetical protein ACREC5_04065, partial [Thermoplasmata archaeon]
MDVVAAEGLGEGPEERPGAADLSTLPEEELRLLAYGSALGPEFELELLHEAMGSPVEELLAQVGRLVELGILRERPGTERFGFVEESARARIYRSMTESRLRVVHAKIALSLERRNPEPAPEVVPELGRHFFLGKIPEKAWRYNLRAARLAQDRNEFENAIHHLERARRDLAGRSGPASGDLAAIDEALGGLHEKLGHPAVADAAYQASLNQVGPEDRRARARLLLARASIAQSRGPGEMDRGLREEALKLSTEIGDRPGQAAAHRLRGRTALQAGDYITALDEAMLALDLIAGEEDQSAQGECATDIAIVFAAMGPDVTEEAIRWLDRAIELFAREGDDFGRVRAFTHLASVVGRSDPVLALEHLSKAREFAERLTSPNLVIRSLLQGTEFRLALGEVEEAERDYQQAARLLERVVDPRSGQMASLSHAMISERRGMWEEAEAAYRKAIARSDELKLAAVAAECEFRLARLRFKTRARPGAREACESARRRGGERGVPGRAPAVRELAA